MNYSNITLKIKGIGTKSVFTHYTQNFLKSYYPDEVYINGNKQSKVQFSNYLDKEDNSIKLVWYNKPKTMYSAFSECSDIYEFDFSNFDTSEVKNFEYMFYGCSSLTSLNLSNFETSLVTNMGYLFWGCSKLEYINMKNFNELKLSSCNDILKGVPDNVVVCINENNNPKILSKLKEKKCYSIDCSYNWKSNQKKQITKTSGCECEVDNCLSCPSSEYNIMICLKIRQKI